MPAGERVGHLDLGGVDKANTRLHQRNAIPAETREGCGTPQPSSDQGTLCAVQKSMSPIPPPAPPAGAAAFFSGFSATMASVVIKRPATEAAS